MNKATRYAPRRIARQSGTSTIAIAAMLLELSPLLRAVPNFAQGSAVAARRPHLSEDAVVRLAVRAAERHGYKLRNFEEPRAPKFDKKDGTWIVFYEGKIRKPGNHFFVIVHDRTQSVEVMEGE